ncbi:MAG: hypothetical protein EOP46_06625 [Sphingobacteriaceae bacterium]|nr:MAG: hypothetical protein EOP46_06625 [Sphingobacteriaceae bacterium]
MKIKLNYFLSIVSIITIILPSCRHEVDYKIVREDVIMQHDKLMADDEKLMHHKMQLDTLALSLGKLKVQQPALDTAKVHQEITAINNKLNAASDKMSNWMQQFKTDADGKSNAQAVAYFGAEKVKVTRLDSIYRNLLKESSAYLEKFNVKDDTATHKHQH